MEAGDGNKRCGWIRDDVQYIRKRVDEIAERQIATTATVKQHGKQIAWLFRIIGALIVLLVAARVGLR